MSNGEHQDSEKFRITEREKFLLKVMVRVMAQGYLPSLGRERDTESKATMETILRGWIDKLTVTHPSN